jgi:dTDP-4-amino-4,6-dideoxygalactose transaminase
MTDLQAALDLSQIHRLDEFVAKRHAIAQCYNELLAELPLATPWQHLDSYSGLHLYVIRLKLNEISKTHCEVFEFLRKGSIGVNLHYITVYRQPYYDELGFSPGLCSVAEQYYAKAISLPLYSGLTRRQQDEMVTALNLAITERSM